MIEVEARGDGAEALVGRVVWICERLGLRDATVGLMVVGPEEMARINGDHRGKPEPTDLKARARALTRVRRLRYYPVRMDGDWIEAQLPE